MKMRVPKDETLMETRETQLESARFITSILLVSSPAFQTEQHKIAAIILSSTLFAAGGEKRKSE